MPENRIFRCVSGSRLYGTHREDSDWDYRGICFPPQEAIFGLHEFEQREEPEGDDRERSEVQGVEDGPSLR